MGGDGWRAGIWPSVWALWAVIALGACQLSQDETRNRMVQFFEEVVFGGLPGDDYATEALTRWNGSVRAVIIGADADEHRTEVLNQLRLAAELAGLAIETHEVDPDVENLLRQIAELVGEFGGRRKADALDPELLRRASTLKTLLESRNTSQEDFDLVVLFVPTGQFFVHERHVPCATYTRSDEGVLSNIFVLISLQDEDMISHCVAHEIAHAFGLFGHSGQVRSVVSPVHGEGEFTRWDKDGAPYSLRQPPEAWDVAPRGHASDSTTGFGNLGVQLGR